jgi:hypothetical protein
VETQVKPLVFYNTSGSVEGVAYEKVGVYLIGVVKEQKKEIDALKAENAGLEKRLKAIEERLK